MNKWIKADKAYVKCIRNAKRGDDGEKKKCGKKPKKPKSG